MPFVIIGRSSLGGGSSSGSHASRRSEKCGPTSIGHRLRQQASRPWRRERLSRNSAEEAAFADLWNRLRLEGLGVVDRGAGSDAGGDARPDVLEAITKAAV